MAFNTGNVPLTEVLPWSTDGEDCILVTDSVATDGRFMLHTIAIQALANKDKVLWLSCGPVPESLVATALRKMGCEAAASYLKRTTRSTDWTHPLAIHCVMVDDLPTSPLDSELYLKNLYQRVQEWCLSDSNNTTIIVDDASVLGNLLGDRTVYFFLSYLRALNSSRLVVRCSNDMDSISNQDDDASVRNPHQSADWVGAGGRRTHAVTVIPWERKLTEFANWIVDVVPLASGYSREAHGRLVFTARAAISEPALVMNYCLQDTAVSAIRLRS
ncbi:hypothetical protein MHU86_17606 [Fragilaria crotonensis]|nr:hypothetical protein MHU86_17606 [Fragilaria crotonensis]